MELAKYEKRNKLFANNDMGPSEDKTINGTLNNIYVDAYGDIIGNKYIIIDNVQISEY